MHGQLSETNKTLALGDAGFVGKIRREIVFAFVEACRKGFFSCHLFLRLGGFAFRGRQTDDLYSILMPLTYLVDRDIVSGFFLISSRSIGVNLNESDLIPRIDSFDMT